MKQEEFSREKIVEAIKDIFEDLDIFLDIVENDDVYGYDMINHDGEIYIIDRNTNKFINWYKLTHVGRDFHTDINTWDEFIDFLTRLKRTKIEQDVKTHQLMIDNKAKLL